jgi:hypothetical protein
MKRRSHRLLFIPYQLSVMIVESVFIARLPLGAA